MREIYNFLIVSTIVKKDNRIDLYTDEFRQVESEVRAATRRAALFGIFAGVGAAVGVEKFNQARPGSFTARYNKFHLITVIAALGATSLINGVSLANGYRRRIHGLHDIINEERYREILDKNGIKKFD